MDKKLAEADGHAIDLLLNRTDAEPGDKNIFIGPGHNLAERLQSAEKILSLLQHVPTADPPADLTRRTLERIAAYQGPNAGAIPQTPADSQDRRTQPPVS
jgi:hypothetical protein